MFLPKFGYLGYFCKIEKLYKKYLTNNPKLPASIELKRISLTLTKTNRETFENELKQWHIKYKSFLRTLRNKGLFLLSSFPP